MCTRFTVLEIKINIAVNFLIMSLDVFVCVCTCACVDCVHMCARTPVCVYVALGTSVGLGFLNHGLSHLYFNCMCFVLHERLLLFLQL